MTNTKKRRKLLWGMQMMMRDIKLFHGWHEPLRSYMSCISQTVERASIGSTSDGSSGRWMQNDDNPF